MICSLPMCYIYIFKLLYLNFLIFNLPNLFVFLLVYTNSLQCMELQSHRNLRGNMLAEMLLSLPQTGALVKSITSFSWAWSVQDLCMQQSLLDSLEKPPKLCKSYTHICRKVVLYLYKINKLTKFPLCVHVNILSFEEALYSDSVIPTPK